MDSRPKAIMALWIALAATIGVGCASVIGCNGGAPEQAGARRVEVKVVNVGFDEDDGTHYVMLREKSGTRTLPILIGDDEARAIMLELRGVKPERPLTYELLRRVIEQTGNRVDRVVIDDMHDQVYYAKIYLDHGRYVIDSRPSDAIALALGASSPIFVAQNLLQSAVQPLLGAAPPIKTGYAFGVTVQELTPALAEYFGVDPQSGVVVADLGPSAGKAGLQRGDIITNVEGHEIRSPEEFTAIAKQTGANSASVTLTVQRGQKTQQFTFAPDNSGAAAQR